MSLMRYRLPFATLTMDKGTAGPKGNRPLPLMRVEFGGTPGVTRGAGRWNLEHPISVGQKEDGMKTGSSPIHESDDSAASSQASSDLEVI